MKTFDVTIQRTERREHIFRVQASSRAIAERRAMQVSCDFNFADASFFCADEQIVGSKEIPRG